MKSVLIMVVLAGLLFGCQSKPQPFSVAAQVNSHPARGVENHHGKTIEVKGVYLDASVPTIRITSHNVSNGRGIVRLSFKDKVPSIQPGMAVSVLGRVQAHNLKVPIIQVQELKIME